MDTHIPLSLYTLLIRFSGWAKDAWPCCCCCCCCWVGCIITSRFWGGWGFSAFLFGWKGGFAWLGLVCCAVVGVRCDGGITDGHCGCCCCDVVCAGSRVDVLGGRRRRRRRRMRWWWWCLSLVLGTRAKSLRRCVLRTPPTLDRARIRAFVHGLIRSDYWDLDAMHQYSFVARTDSISCEKCIDSSIRGLLRPRE
jgi:hypothetical protein